MPSTPPSTTTTTTWKEAASLIVVARDSSLTNAGVDERDYRIMMVKRSGLSSFMASAYVFPGGKVEIADYSPQWWQLFSTLGISKHDLTKFSTGIIGSRPPMITDPITLSEAKKSDGQHVDYLSADIALRISAIRETFEETGVLLLTKPSSVKSTGKISQSAPLTPISDQTDGTIDLLSWRERVRSNANAFLELCSETGLCPDLWSLYEWWDWLTPISVGHRRFDAMFYICCLEKQPKVVLDNSEVTTLMWCTPLEMLEEHIEEKIFLAPPQVYELSRIHRLPHFVAVQEFAMRRQPLGVQRWLPVISTYNDGALSVLPGDDYYPQEPDIIGKKPIPDFPQSLEEMRSRAKRLNRLELRGPTCMALCNVAVECGQLSPITYPPVLPSLKSLL